MADTVKVFAHRGDSALFAENTRAAFAHALAIGAHGIETDIQLSADGHPVCWHDTTVDRTSNGRGPVRDHSLAELRELDVHSWKYPAPTLPSQYGTSSNQLMTLDELTKMLFEADRPVELALEMKISDGNEHQIAECIVDWLQRWGWNPDSGTLGGATSKVSLSALSFPRKALPWWKPLSRQQGYARCLVLKIVRHCRLASRVGTGQINYWGHPLAGCHAMNLL